MIEPLLSVRNMTKRFGGLVAVNNVSFAISRGEVVGLLGDNGAGKSTLIKCISGVHHADEGEIFFDGKPVRFSHPIDARRHGVETIYQDLALANNLDVGANIFLGREVKKIISAARSRRSTSATCCANPARRSISCRSIFRL